MEEKQEGLLTEEVNSSPTHALVPRDNNRKNFPSAQNFYLIERINMSWNGKMIRVQHEALYIQYLMACLSTLGGAYHLCNRPFVAFQIACKQERIARYLGSSSQLIRARTYQAVNLALLGKQKLSRISFAECKSYARIVGNEDMYNFVIASELWLANETKISKTF
jgi:hypothetical protein